MIPDCEEPLAGTWQDSKGKESPAPDLWVRFFETFEMFCRGEPLDLGRNSNAIAIFKCLLARRGRPISQDVLIGWLWPESSPKKGRWSLNSAVYILRRSLDERLPEVPSSKCVILKRGHYRMAQNLRLSSDVEKFDACYERGRFLERARKTEDAASEYEDAVALYRGDYLAEDLYEDWTMIERERLTSAYVDVLDRLAPTTRKPGTYRKVSQPATCSSKRTPTMRRATGL